MTRRLFGLPRIPGDIRYALQQVRRHPAPAVVIVLSLAIGIGANTAIFSVVNGVMLRDLPIADPSRLLVLQYAQPGRGGWPAALDHSHSGRSGRDASGRPMGLSISWPSFTYLQSRARLSTLAGFVPLGMVDKPVALVHGEPLLVDADMVTAGFFPALGVTPAVGRGIVPGDEQPDAARVAVISDRFWSRAYARGREALGDTVMLNGIAVTIVGIAPRTFEGLEVGRSPDLWIQMGPRAGLTPWGVPSKKAPEVVFAAADYWWLPVVARLKPGVAPEPARVELERLFQESVRAAAGTTVVPPDKMPGVSLTPAAQGLNIAGLRLSDTLSVLMVVVGLVLLVACANVATLLLARATARRREMALRMALGAARWRLVRQLLTESLLYAAAGAGVGAVVAAWGAPLLLVLLQWGRDPIPVRVGLDASVLGFTALVSLATTLLFGLAPALSATRLDLGSDLKENSPTARGGRPGRLRGGKALVAVQVALSLPLVLGAGLFLRTLDNLERQPLGFDPSRLLLFRLDATKGNLTGDRLIAAYGDIRDRVSALPGVQAVTASRLGLMTGWISNGPITVEDERLNLNRASQSIHWNMVAPGFFDTMGMRLKLGRAIDDRDGADSPKVAVVNESLAQRFFPGQNPLGRRFWFGRTREGDSVEIVGVVADAKYSTLRQPAPPTAFLPYTQDTRHPLTAVFFEVRAAGDPGALVPAITRIVHDIVPGVPLDQVKTQSQQIAESLGQETMYARLFTLFGVVALVLACVGLYGTMSFALARRTREIGIRMALGAAGGRLLRASLLEAVTVAAAGIGAGALVAWSGARYVRSLLFGVTPLDAPTIVGAVGVMLAVTLAAAYLPARRAAHLDPLRALREE